MAPIVTEFLFALCHEGVPRSRFQIGRHLLSAEWKRTG